MTLVEVLRAGKARLLERGWCQGDDAALFADEPRKCCAATAICGLRVNTCLSTVDFIKDVNGIPHSTGLSAWNDAPERTLEDVLSAYDKAIAAAEALETTQ